jgi:hypothetical protein
MRFMMVTCVLLCAGCMTQQAYDGPKLARDEVARVSGDLRFNAGLPVMALLRQVDGRVIAVSENAVDVQPGKHQLLVDCVVREPASTSRYSLDVEVYAGERYRLVAETGPGLRECTAVRLESSR